MTTTVDAPARRPNHYLQFDFYRDSWSHLNAVQRIELRKEYRFLRAVGLRPHQAKGAIYRVVNVSKGWD